jgi:glycosyltransferase involved in cell wall biosynthesis
LPTVSIITPCYNASRFIDRTLASVRAQTLTDWEHVVVDDGSTDDSAARVAAWAASDLRFKLVQQSNGGMQHARNAGLAVSADSPYLLFLDADDTLEPEMLRAMAAHLDAHPDVGMVYCIFRPVDADDRPLPAPPAWMDVTQRSLPTWRGTRTLDVTQRETPFEVVMHDFCAIPSSWVMRRSVFERTQRWDETASLDDKDIALQMTALAPLHLLPRQLVNYRRHDANMSLTDPLWLKSAQVRSRWWRGQALPPGTPTWQGRRAVLLSRWARAHQQLQAASESVRHRRPHQAAAQAVQGMKHVAALLLGCTGLRTP